MATGTHSLSDFYTGDTNNPYGWSTPIVITIQPAPVNLGTSCWNSSFPYGGNYQCSVNASSNAGAGQGNIACVFDSNPAVVIPLNGGDAQFTIVEPSSGSHTVAIAYARQGNYSAAGPNLQSFTVTPAPVYVALTPSGWYAAAGTNITFQAAASSWSAGAPNATGSFSFYDGGSLLATLSISATGTSSFSSSTLATGSHTITATYAGGANYASGSASITITVAQ